MRPPATAPAHPDRALHQRTRALTLLGTRMCSCARSCARSAGVAARRAIRAGEDRSRHPLEDPPRSDGQLADHADAARADRRLRPAPDRIAEPEGGRGLGGQGDDAVGPEERPPRAVGVRSSRLGQRALVGARRSRRSRTRWSSKRWRGRRAPTAPSPRRSVQIDLPSQPTKERADAFFDANRAKVKGRSCMVGAPAVVPRHDPDAAASGAKTTTCARSSIRSIRTASGGFGGGGPAGAPPDPNVVPANQVTEQLDQFLVDRRRRRPRQRCGPRPRPDPRLQQPHLRRHQGRADRRDAQRGLRPHLAPAGRRHAGRSSS